MSDKERLEEIERATKVMKEYFGRPDFKLTNFNYDAVIEDLQFLIEQNKRYREARKEIEKKRNEYYGYQLAGNAEGLQEAMDIIDKEFGSETDD